MKRESKKVVGNIGMVDFGQLELSEDYIQVFIPVESMSEELNSAMMKEIEIDKEKVLSERKKYCVEQGRPYDHKWSDKGVNIFYIFLNVHIKDKKIECSLNVCYEDLEDELLENSIIIDADLSQHIPEIKKHLLKAIIDKFF